MLRYDDAVVDNIRVGEGEFNTLMDKLGSAIGDELRKRELANAHHQDALTPDEDRRSLQIPPGQFAEFPGPDRRDMRNKATNKGLFDVHKKGTIWLATDNNGTIWTYQDGNWIVNNVG